MTLEVLGYVIDREGYVILGLMLQLLCVSIKVRRDIIVIFITSIHVL